MSETGVRVQELRPGDPEELGRHRVVGRLGAGGMGVVFLAEGPFGRVAVKLVREDLADDPEFRRRFQREVQACFRVSGARTARLVDFDLAAVRPWLATEFVDAPSLADQVRADGRLSTDDQLLLASGLAEALVSIHSTGMVHRDLKPSNVLWTPHGPKVIDFGIAAAADAAALTTNGHFVGTPGWHSPEQVSGQEATGAADVFAWGSLICYAASGRAPFGTGPVEVILHRVSSGEPNVDRELIAPALRGLVVNAMAREASDRPTAADLYTALVGSAPGDASVPATRVLAGGPGDTPPSTPVPISAAVPPTRPWSATVVGGADGLPPAAPATRRRRRLAVVLGTTAVVLLAAAGTVIGLLLTSGGGDGDDDGGSSGTDNGVQFSATAPWRLTVDDQVEGDDPGCTIDLVDTVSGQTGRFTDLYGRKTMQIAATGEFRWTVSNDSCVVTATAGSGSVALPFAQQGYSGDTDAFQAEGPILVDPVDLEEGGECELTMRAVDGRTLDFVTAHQGAGPVQLDPGQPGMVYLAEPPCGVKISANW
ncbi:serine/threonine-protein kinase [Pseudofrankia sp. BMG5.37]|uniref:serine/threonine-protein kinase n=1 Tax=Pseudofrankia sp. BMG5.37 TaxID=3050035 RepID=UPI002894CA7B|nr:serine/threonine-protein kinase [Pseudofrankia sp. BMG5.37]MDT3440049.1 serine/threonine-protein kinase [Pseudofrankia sp. BMG5.37]